MLSKKEQQITKSIELMFQGLEDDPLKDILLAVALNKSEEEKERIAEQIRLKNERDYEDMRARFEVEVSSENPYAATELTTESKVIINGTD
jgi:hypothetical protein